MKRILIIEDDETLLNNISILLEEEGYSIFKAKDGIEGINVALEFAPDLIICDIMMPRKDGFEVCKTLKKIPQYSSIPLIFLTAKTQVEDLRKGMSLGADDFIPKPFRLEDLLNSIKIRLSKHDHIHSTNDESIENISRNPSIGFFIYRNGKFVHVNKSLSEILEISKTSLKVSGMNVFKLSEQSDNAKEQIHCWINGIYETVLAEIELLTKSGYRKKLDFFGTTICYRGKESLMGAISMHERKNKKIHINDYISNPDNLTKQEIKVLRLICQGKTTLEIANILFISKNTVNCHRVNILQKTNCKNAAELVTYTLKNNMEE